MKKTRLAFWIVFGLSVRDCYSLFLGKWSLWTPVMRLKAQALSPPKSEFWKHHLTSADLTQEQSSQMPTYKFHENMHHQKRRAYRCYHWWKFRRTCPFLDTAKLSQKSQSCANKVSFIMLLSAIFVCLNKHVMRYCVADSDWVTFMSNQLLNEAGMYGPLIKVDNQGTESEISSWCQLHAHRARQALHFHPSILSLYPENGHSHSSRKKNLQ